MGLRRKRYRHRSFFGINHTPHQLGRKAGAELVCPYIWLLRGGLFVFSPDGQYRDDHRPNARNWHSATIHQLWRVFAVVVYNIVVYLY